MFILRRLPSSCLAALLCGLVQGFNVSLTPAEGLHANASSNATVPQSTNGTLWSNATSTSVAVTTSASSTIDLIASCDRQWAAYSRSSILAYKPVSEQTFTKVVISTETVYQTTYTCSSTCGNVCYADPTTTATDFSTITSTQLSTSTQWSTYDGPQPSCTVPSASCTSLWDGYSSSIAAYMSWYNVGWPPEAEPPWPATPGCSMDTCKQTGCVIGGTGQLQVYYWPEPTTVVRDMCTDFPAQKPVDPYASGANTSYAPVTTAGSVEIDGRTFYEGNVYLSIQAAWATNNCGSTLGPVRSNIMLTLASSQLFSVRNDRVTQGWAYPVNYADFNAPYPWSAYKGALHDCASGMNFNTGPWCAKSVVFEDQFHPVLQLPIQIQSLDPLWAGCRPMDALLDPPVALSTAEINTTANHPPVAVETDPAPASSATPAPSPTPVLSPDRNGEQPGQAGSVNQQRPSATTGYDVSISTPQVTVGPTLIPVAPNGEGLVLSPGITISKGGPTAVIDGTTISYGSAYITLQSPSGASSIAIQPGSKPSNVVVGSRTFSVDSTGALVAPGITLRPDSPATTLPSGAIVSVGPAGVTIMDPSSGSIKYIPFSALASTTMLRIGAQYFALDANGNLVLANGQTLHPGDPAVTIGGTVVSVGTAGVVLDDSKGAARTVKVGGGASGADAVEVTSPEKALGTSSTVLGGGSGAGRPAATTSKKGAAVAVEGARALKALCLLVLMGSLFVS